MNPANLKYSKDHEWVKAEGNHAIVGITDFAQQQLGDIVFVDMPKVGSQLTEGKLLGVVESVKTVSDILAPASGTVTKVNTELESNPALVNQVPYGQGWIIEMELLNAKDLEDLLDSSQYEEYCAQCDH